MHPNQSFRGAPEAEALDFARARGFGCLTVNGPEGPVASHVPFLVEEGRIEGHLTRRTALARLLVKGARPAVMIVSGPDGYISPDWYGVEDKVPTWNYIAVHLRGEARLAREIDMRTHVDRLSARFEETLAPKAPWSSAKMRLEALAPLMRIIVPFELRIERVESTFKLNQNRGETARAGAAAALEAGGTPGMETAELARLMRLAKDA